MESAEELPEVAEIADDLPEVPLEGEEVAAPQAAEAAGAPPDDQGETGAVDEAPAVEEVRA